MLEMDVLRAMNPVAFDNDHTTTKRSKLKPLSDVKVDETAKIQVELTLKAIKKLRELFDSPTAAIAVAAAIKYTLRTYQPPKKNNR